MQKWRYYRPIKKLVTLRVEADVPAWFKKPGQGYQTRINRTLRKVMEEGKKAWSEAKVALRAEVRGQIAEANPVRLGTVCLRQRGGRRYLR